ncbi:3'-5' exonuclease [Nonomuraea zeae]|uniref:3'-5' exonuclease n=1 Tax=Nonomuraea zeae TaxID=1642303 RepID=A0A5S4GYL7_9ACTN|nr:3'-5' exonuclease [Nonomuraea zeae]
MRLPPDVPVTELFVTHTGITAAMLARAAPAAQVMARLEARLNAPPYRLVAHSAHTEATLIGGQRRHCPTLAAIPLICTVKLARALLPELRSHKLDLVARRLGLALPADRHRAMPDVELTSKVFTRLTVDGVRTGRWRTLLELQRVGGINPKPRFRRAGRAGEDVRVQPVRARAAHDLLAEPVPRRRRPPRRRAGRCDHRALRLLRRLQEEAHHRHRHRPGLGLGRAGLGARQAGAALCPG